jgi:alkylmercury lyase-like protein
MVAATQLDRTHHFILETFVERGYAPHYTEIARRFGVAPEEGKRLLHELMDSGLPMWVHPGTDLIASVAPFSNLPTQYRITVDGRPGWFGQCGFASLAATWVFPGKTVQIDSPCLDCGEPLRIVVRDGIIERLEPEGIAGYVDVPFGRWSKDWPFT